MKFKKSRIIGIGFSAFGIAALITFTAVANTIAEGYGDTLQAALGDLGKGHTNVSYDGVNPTYYENEFTDENEKEEYQKSVSYNIVKEGITLLEKGNIPYANNTKVSLFSKSSVNFIFGGTGSGTASSSLNLKEVFEENGFDVNDSLWNFYKDGAGKKYQRGVGSINYGDSDDYSINECPLPVIQSDTKVVNSFNEYNTAVFVLSRTGGEGNDLARGMNDYVDTSKDLSSGYHVDAEGDKKKSYLEPDSIELQIIDYLNKNFKDVILIVNCNNSIELGWTKKYDKISTVLSVPGTGSYGLEALPQILNGEVTPSGHLTDTYAYNAFSSPAMMNMGDFEYLTNGNKVPNYEGQSWANGYYYVTYNEGIYVGYRYYETRYEDQVLNKGNAKKMSDWEVNESKELGDDEWNYANEVMYPFGYGLSTTDFEWSDFKVTEDEDSFICTVKVTNIGDVAGKDVVELYAQTPYGDYEKENKIEKSSIQLVDFKKTTQELKPNESEVVTLSFDKKDLASYDYLNKKTYVLSEGQYYFTVAKDAHAAINNILRVKGVSVGDLIASPSETTAGDPSLVNTSFVNDTLDYTSFSKDETTGKDITNVFDVADLNTYGENITYLSRNDWEGTYPKTYGDVSTIKSIHSERINGTDKNGEPVGYEYYKELSKDSEIYKLLQSYDSLNPLKESDINEDITWDNKDVELDLIDLRGRDYSDPLWNVLISKISVKEASALIQNGGYKTEMVESINKPETSDKDGPAGLNSVAGHFALGPTYPCGLIIAQTWNSELAYEKGNSIALDCYANNVTGWYGPADNIHRTPFGGRNFEYYSEDPVISSNMAKEETIGVAKKGIFVYLKHFALNNQEIHREKESGLCTYSNEQAIREIYLKAFEDVVKGNEIDETYYEVEVDNSGKLVKDENGNYKFTKKTTKVNACLGVMSSFNRVGPVWAGGNYNLITMLLRQEWGFEGAVLTDYYHTWFMDTKQAVMAGGSMSLDPSNESFLIDTNDKVYEYQARESVKSTLYMVANSYAMEGYIHGVKPTAVIPVYRIILYVLDGVCVAGCLVLLFLIYRMVRKQVKENNNAIKVENN